MALYDGTVQDRFDRDWQRRGDDVKERSFDQRSAERQAREYVDPETGVSASGVSDPDVTEFWEEKNG